MALDIAMGGSTNTILHLLAAAQEAGVDVRPWTTSTGSRAGCRTSARSRRRRRALPHGGRAPRRRHPRDPRRAGPGAGCSTRATCTPCTARPSATTWPSWDVRRTDRAEARRASAARRPARRPSQRAFSQTDALGRRSTRTRAEGCIRDVEHAYSKDGGLAVLHGNLAARRLRREDRGRGRVDLDVRGPGAGLRDAGRTRSRRSSASRSRPATSSSSATRARKGGPGMQEMLLPDALPQGPRPRQGLRAGHRRPLLRRHLRPVHRPRLAGGRRRAARSRSSRTATASASTSRTARIELLVSDDGAGAPARGDAGRAAPRRGRRATASARCRARSAPTRRWRRARRTARCATRRWPRAPAAPPRAPEPRERSRRADGLRSGDLLHRLLDGPGRARPRAGGAGVRVALGAGAFAHPAVAPVAVPPGRRPAQEVLRRDGSVRDAGRGRGGDGAR